jgi:hypothetical protein
MIHKIKPKLGRRLRLEKRARRLHLVAALVSVFDKVLLEEAGQLLQTLIKRLRVFPARLGVKKLVRHAIHSGELVNAEYDKIDLFNLQYPKAVKGVPDELLNPKAGWKDPEAFDQSLEKLAGLFKENFIEYADKCSYEVKSAGPFF